MDKRQKMYIDMQVDFLKNFKQDNMWFCVIDDMAYFGDSASAHIMPASYCMLNDMLPAKASIVYDNIVYNGESVVKSMLQNPSKNHPLEVRLVYNSVEPNIKQIAEFIDANDDIYIFDNKYLNASCIYNIKHYKYYYDNNAIYVYEEGQLIKMVMEFRRPRRDRV